MAFVLMTSPLLASAVPVTVNFNGVIQGYGSVSGFGDAVSNPSPTPTSIWSGGPAAGTTFSGSYIFDDESADNLTGRDDIGSYPIFGFEGEIGGQAFETRNATNGGISIFNNISPTNLLLATADDTYALRTGSCCATATFDRGFEFVGAAALIFTGDDVIDDDSLFLPDLSQFPTAQFQFCTIRQFSGIQCLAGDVTTLSVDGGDDGGSTSVAEPASLGLFSVGFLGMLIAMRRKREGQFDCASA